MIIVPADSHANEPGATIAVEVQQVFDGDGFLGRAWNPYRGAWVERVPFRLAFIDAPEMNQPFGRQARDFLSAQIDGRLLDLIPVLKGSKAPSFIDPYRRVLCVPLLTDTMEAGRIDYYWNGCRASGSVRKPRLVTRNIELEMVVNGWAWVIERYAFEQETEYFAAQESARRDRRGLWSEENPEAPWKFKVRQKRMKDKYVGQNRLL